VRPIMSRLLETSSATSPCVGHRGIEPRDTALSGRPRRPAGWWPAESGALEAHARRRALVSSKARPLAGSLSSVPDPGLEPGTFLALNEAPLSSWASPAWSGYRESDPDLHHGKVMRCHYAISAWSALGAIRTRTAGDLNAVPPAIGLRGHRAATRCRPGSPSLRGRGRSRARRRS
jgi:hypothetical protein